MKTVLQNFKSAIAAQLQPASFSCLSTHESSEGLGLQISAVPGETVGTDAWSSEAKCQSIPNAYDAGANGSNRANGANGAEWCIRVRR